MITLRVRVRGDMSVTSTPSATSLTVVTWNEVVPDPRALSVDSQPCRSTPSLVCLKIFKYFHRLNICSLGCRVVVSVAFLDERQMFLSC